MATPDSCPCGSGHLYAECCRPLHDGFPAPTAARLMRARYAAYAVGRADCVARTWHPLTRPTGLDPDGAVTWRRLQIVDTSGGEAGDADGVVEFRASYRTAEGAGLLHERSRFTWTAGEWVYIEGDILED